MIREDALREAIAECEGSRNPNASTCVKLAAFYTILNQMHGKQDTYTPSSYSFAMSPDIQYSDTEFSRIVEEKGIDKCFPIIDEIMSALLVINPSLYQSAIRRLKS